MQRILKAVRRTLVDVLRDCNGPTAVEYAVLLGLIVLVAMGAIMAIGNDWEKAIYAQLAQSVPS